MSNTPFELFTLHFLEIKDRPYSTRFPVLYGESEKNMLAILSSTNNPTKYRSAVINYAAHLLKFLHDLGGVPTIPQSIKEKHNHGNNPTIEEIVNAYVKGFHSSVSASLKVASNTEGYGVIAIPQAAIRHAIEDGSTAKIKDLIVASLVACVRVFEDLDLTELKSA
jgi:hypothetical protein